MRNTEEAEHAHCILLMTLWMDNIQFPLCNDCVCFQQFLKPVLWQCSYQQFTQHEAQKLLLLNSSLEYHFHYTSLPVTGGATCVFSIRVNRISNPSVQKINYASLLISGVRKCGCNTESDVRLVWKVWSFVLQLLHPSMAICRRFIKIYSKLWLPEAYAQWGPGLWRWYTKAPTLTPQPWWGQHMPNLLNHQMYHIRNAS